MAPDTDGQEIDVEDVLSKLNLDEKISLLSGEFMLTYSKKGR